MSELESLQASFFALAGIFAVMITPIYLIMIYRMRKTDAMEVKLTKICMFIKIKFPIESKGIFT